MHSPGFFFWGGGVSKTSTVKVKNLSRKRKYIALQKDIAKKCKPSSVRGYKTKTYSLMSPWDSKTKAVLSTRLHVPGNKRLKILLFLVHEEIL